MKTNDLLRKLNLEGKEFATSEDMKRYCRSLKLDYASAISYMVSRRYIVRIFRGIFYVKTFDEIKLGRAKYSHLDMVSKGLELKGVKNWYFGLYTALKLSNVTHEHFTIDYVINDKIFRAKPMKIAGYKFRFIKLKPDLLKFGIIKNSLKYSDLEKTILDFIHIWLYNGVPKEKIIMDISEYTGNISKKRLTEYANKYHKTVRKMAEAIK